MVIHSKSSRRWLQEHFNDPYVKKSQQEGQRSRAIYKLQEIQEKDRILRPGMIVVDLGAAPGSWAQLAKDHVGQKGKVFALDILPIDPIPGVICLQGDFQEQTIMDALLSEINGEKVDVVMSDLAPNISGNNSVDQPRAMYLAELALDFAQQTLKQDGTFLTKLFQGTGVDIFIPQLRTLFRQVVIRKPQASRARSREIFIVAKGYKN